MIMQEEQHLPRLWSKTATWMGKLRRHMLRDIPVGRAVTLFPDDILLVSYPRSGNTWVRFLLSNLRDPASATSFSDVGTRAPDIYHHSDRKLRRVPRPRLLKSHEYLDPRYGTVIYLMRDPRDVALSYYRYQLKVRRVPAGQSTLEFVERFVSGELGHYGTWAEHVGGWLGARELDPRFLLVRYEDLLADTYGSLSRIATFLGLGSSPQQLHRAIDLSTAARMRRMEREQADDWAALRWSRQDIPFVGGASSGQGIRELPAQCLELINETWSPLLGRLGY